MITYQNAKKELLVCKANKEFTARMVVVILFKL